MSTNKIKINYFHFIQCSKVICLILMVNKQLDMEIKYYYATRIMDVWEKSRPLYKHTKSRILTKKNPQQRTHTLYNT
jgi:hypothetical protein